MSSGYVSRRSLVLTTASIALLISLTLIFFNIAAANAQEETTEKEPPRDESVVGGTAVKDGQYKFVVGILDKQRSGNAYDRQFCGGTLIDRNSVLTAAHCMEGKSANSLEVTVGRTVLSSNQGVIRPVTRIRIHPGFKGSDVNFRYDAAVLTLGSPVTSVSPVEISGPSDNRLERAGNILFVAGWGNTVRQPISGSPRSNFPDRMRQAKVPVASDARTAKAYSKPSLPSELRFYSPLMLGAGKTGKDSCQGDSGGPVFSKTNKFVQVGITSYGAGCGAQGYPGVYTEINAPKIRSFIVGSAK